MAINVVTGVGPRVGSSFVMQQCKAKGLYVNGDKFLHGILPEEGNPGGYYDLFPWEICEVKQGVAKVWPVSLGSLRVPVKKIIILHRRDVDKQIQSTIKQMDREPIKTEFKAEEIIAFSEYMLSEWLAVNDDVIHRSYYTEDLDNCIDEIVTFLGD